MMNKFLKMPIAMLAMATMIIAPVSCDEEYFTDDEDSESLALIAGKSFVYNSENHDSNDNAHFDAFSFNEDKTVKYYKAICSSFTNNGEFQVGYEIREGKFTIDVHDVTITWLSKKSIDGDDIHNDIFEEDDCYQEKGSLKENDGKYTFWYNGNAYPGSSEAAASLWSKWESNHEHK